MKRVFLAVVLFVPMMLIAEDVTVPTISEWAKLIEALGGLKGASTWAVVAVAVQAVMLALRTQLGELAGVWRLVIMSGLTAGGVLVAALAAGTDLGAALVSSVFLAALQNFLHQLYKQLFEKK